MSDVTYVDLATALKDRDFIKSSELIEYFYVKHKENFPKYLLLNGCLPEPLSMTYDAEQYILDVFYKSCQLTEKLFETESNTLASEFKKMYIKTISKIISIQHNVKSSADMLYNNKFLKFPFAKQIQMWSTFLENQSRLASMEVIGKIEERGYTTGIEQEVSNNGQQSIHDVLEAGFEIFDTLVRFLQYNSKGKIDTAHFQIHKNISPYNIPSVEEIGHLASLRQTYEFLWEYIKYDEWELEIYNKNGKPFHLYKSSNLDNFKKERAAKIRYNINYATKMQQETYIYSRISGAKDKLFGQFDFSLDNFDTLLRLDVNSYKIVEELINTLAESSVSNLKEWLGSKYETIRFGSKSNITINDLLQGAVYLKTIAFIYQSRSHVALDETKDETYQYLAPVVDIDKLIAHFAQLYEKDLDGASEIIKFFVFYTKPMLDVFSQPLIYVGNNHIVFTPSVVDQMNVERVLQLHFLKWKVDISKKGFVFEDVVRTTLQESNVIQVNPKPIKFPAFDGRDAEFDVIITFNGKLLLIELKCLLRPFSPKEYKNREEDVLYGVEQVNRRAEVVKKQWKTFREHVDIPLPIDPPKDSDIIKLVCLNIFDFTGRIEGDVYITDLSSLAKFFISPVIDKYEMNRNMISVKTDEVLWEGRPEIEQFIQFLKSPIAMRKIYNNLQVKTTFILMIEEDDYQIAFADFKLTADPHASDFRGNAKINWMKKIVRQKKKSYKAKTKKEKQARKRNRKK